jgi:hypothetical protein
MRDDCGGNPGKIALLIASQHPAHEYSRHHFMPVRKSRAGVNYLLEPLAALPEIVKRHS